MTDDLDKSLEDLISNRRRDVASARKNQEATRVSGRVQKSDSRQPQRFGGGNRDRKVQFPNPRDPTPWDEPRRTPGRRIGPIDFRRLHISGLEFSVIDEDLKELFEAVGPVEKVWVDYDRTDRSLGTGTVIFENPEDAQRAKDLYDKRAIDGAVITLAFDESPRRGGSGHYGGFSSDRGRRQRDERSGFAGSRRRWTSNEGRGYGAASRDRWDDNRRAYQTGRRRYRD